MYTLNVSLQQSLLAKLFSTVLTLEDVCDDCELVGLQEVLLHVTLAQHTGADDTFCVAARALRCRSATVLQRVRQYLLHCIRIEHFVRPGIKGRRHFWSRSVMCILLWV